MFEHIANLVREEIHELREGAAYSGEYSDRGASNLQDQLDAWQAGLNGTVPRSFKSFAAAASNITDPEWAEYQRLKLKFGGK